jgi:iron complex outermembrane recepter protein
MSKLKPIVAGVATAFGAAGLFFSLPAFAQQTQQPAQAQKIERVEVTGSNIKRTQVEGPLPVAIITREEIERKGVTSTNELIRSLSYMSSFNDELTSNSPNTTGAATVGFRGLAGDQTVVLLNGRRLANYGFDGAFVNLNTIPLGAIERVEVLKDGAAAIYGADAIGGVVNFITRKDYRGLDSSASYGVSSEGDSAETNVALTGGLGDLGQDKYNVLLNFNYFKRDPLNNLDRERTRTADFRRFGGGNQLSTFAPTGNFVNPNTGLQSPFQPCPTPELLVSPSPLTPGAAGSSSCLFDFAPYRTTVYSTERFSGLAAGRLALSANHQAFAELMLSRSESFASAAPAPGNITLAAGNPANPFPSAITVRGRPLQAGPRTTNNVADSSRIVLGLDGTLGAYDYNVGIGQAKNKVVNEDGGYFLTDRLFPAIANGSFNPFSLNNPASIIQSISSSDSRVGETSYTFVDAKVSGELFQLGGGAAAFAAGLVLGNEKIEDTPGPNQIAGNVFGSIRQSAVVADRRLQAGYLELAAPFTKQIEAQFAVRHDRYEGGTNSTTPKVALRYQPVNEVLFRASYSEGFKMPSLRDLFGGLNQSADSVQDFPGCAARNVAPSACPRLQYDRFSGGNSELKPEKAKSYTLGMLVEPTDSVTLGLDYFSINKTDEIGLVLTQFVIDNVPYVPGATTTLGGNPAFSVARNAGGTITAVNTSQGNLGERKIRGVDVSGQVRIPIAGMKLSITSDTTYYSKYDYADQPGTPLYNRLGLLNLPRWRTTLTTGLQYGPWDGILTYNNLAKMFDKPQSTAATPVTPADKIVGHFETLDFGLSYAGFKGLKLSFQVKNLMDKEPPFSNNDPRTLGFAQVHDIRGRFFQVGASYKFF